MIRSNNKRLKYALAPLSGLSLIVLAGCHTDMWTQPKVHKPLQESDFFADGSSARLQVPGTVVHTSADKLKVGNPFYSGIGPDGKLVDELPESIPLTKENLERGRSRYNIYCSPCHGRSGDGKGMIATRGLSLRREPGNYHTDRLRKMPLGHFYDVMTNGFGVMYSYASRIEPEDRWKIAAYIRVLQASQNHNASTLSPDELDKVNGKKAGLQEEPAAGAKE